MERLFKIDFSSINTAVLLKAESTQAVFHSSHILVFISIKRTADKERHSVQINWSVLSAFKFMNKFLL